MSGLKQYWQGLEARERRLLLIGGGLALAIVFYSLLWEPWHERIRSLRVEVPSKYQDLVWLTWQKDHLRGVLSKKQARALSKPASVLTFIEQSATRLGLRKSLSISPGRNGQTRIIIKQAPFDQALAFAQALSKAGFRLEAVLFKGADTPGQVDATLTIGG